MNKLWHDKAWEEYEDWLCVDKKTVAKINKLIRSIERNGYDCIGKPEPLKHYGEGVWSVQIDEKNRLIFAITNGQLEIYSCRGHYDD